MFRRGSVRPRTQTRVWATGLLISVLLAVAIYGLLMLANWREIKSMNYQTVTFVLEDDSTKARVTNAVAEVHTKTSPSRISLFLARAFGLRKSMKTKEATIRLSTGTIALQVPRRFNVFHEIFFVAPG